MIRCCHTVLDIVRYCHTRLHLGFSAKLRIWQVPACKMEPRSGIISWKNHPPTQPYGFFLLNILYYEYGVSWQYMEGVWGLSRECQEGVWNLSGRCLEGVWNLSGTPLENDLKMSAGFLEVPGQVRSKWYSRSEMFWTKIFLPIFVLNF